MHFLPLGSGFCAFRNCSYIKISHCRILIEWIWVRSSISLAKKCLESAIFLRDVDIFIGFRMATFHHGLIFGIGLHFAWQKCPANDRFVDKRFTIFGNINRVFALSRFQAAELLKLYCFCIVRLPPGIPHREHLGGGVKASVATLNLALRIDD